MSQPVIHLTFPATVTQRAREVLEPFLPHDPEISPISTPDPANRRLLLHPRVTASSDLPEAVQNDCAALGGVWGIGDLGQLTAAQRVRLFTVVFFSRSRLSPALQHGLPRTWRQVLSNFYPADLVIDGAPYASIEHYFQGQKALCSDRPEIAAWFRSDTTGPDAIDPEPLAAKKAGGKGAYRRIGATLDPAVWEQQRVTVTRTALTARWEQDALYRAVLHSTRGLNLLHFERAGARSFWGGSLRKVDGQPQGGNQLGKMLTALREQRP